MPAKSDTIKKARKKNKGKASTQEYLHIAEIRDNIVVLKNGSLRAVLLVSSVNLALKSEEEQEATFQSFMMFLNSLSFPLQIVVQSRKLDIDNYRESLKKKAEEQTNDLLKQQTLSYIEFISELVSLGEIMSKKFYVVVPYDPAQDQRSGFFSRLSAIFMPETIIKLREDKFRKYKYELDKRIDLVMSSLMSMGITSVQLDTASLIELYYNTYNPDIAKNEKLPEVSDLAVEDVK